MRNSSSPSSNVSNSASPADPTFAFLMQDIFSQAMSEIEESRAHTHLKNVNNQNSLPEQICPFEPLIDPAVFYISDMLSDQDEHFIDFNGFSTFQGQEDNLTDFLKEDSPFLAQDMLFSPNVNMQGILSPVENVLLQERPLVEQSCLNSQEMGAVTIQIQATGMNDTEARRNKPRARAHKGSAADRFLKPRKEQMGCRKKPSGRPMAASEVGELVDLIDLFWQSAQAVGVNNTKRALEILKKIKQHVNPYGNGEQRLGYYFAEALDARFSGTGWPLYLGLLRHHPSPSEVLQATSVYIRSCPFIKASHYFINQTILNVAKGASKLQIMDLQIAGGFNYPSLIKALSERSGGPPSVKLVGVGFPHYSMMPDKIEVIFEGVQKTGQQLSEIAEKHGVPFEFVPWAGMRDNFVMQEFVNGHREKGDVLVIISAHLLRYVMDETLDSPSARLRMLKMGRHINPDVYIQGIVTGAYSTPFFTRRFREALFHFESLFDVLDTFIGRDDQDRLVFESEILGKAIVNIVACEGMEVVERIDKYKHWQEISEEAGFHQLQLNEDIKQTVQAMLKSWHKEYTISEDSQYMLMGWKGRVLHAMSTWGSSSS